MLGILRAYKEKFTAANKYPHDYVNPYDTFHPIKKQFHFYDFVIHLITIVFIFCTFYIIFTELEGSPGYIVGCVGIIALSSLLY